MTMTDDDARRRTAEARAKLWSTLSGQKVNASDADTSTAVEYRPISDVIKLNAAKQEMRDLLAGMPATVVKQNAGIRSVVEDSNMTNLQPGQGVYDGGYQSQAVVEPWNNSLLIRMFLLQFLPSQTGKQLVNRIGVLTQRTMTTRLISHLMPIKQETIFWHIIQKKTAQ
jgi:hypothetical protein